MPPRPESNTAIGSSVRSMVRPPSRISYRMHLLYHIRRSFQVRRWRAAFGAADCARASTAGSDTGSTRPACSAPARRPKPAAPCRARRGRLLLPRESGAAAAGSAAARPAGDAAHAGHDGLPHQLRLRKARLPVERAGGLHPHRPRAIPQASMKTSPGAMLRGMFFGDRLAVCCAPVCAYLFQGLAGSGSVGSQPRFGLEMSSHGADGFGTGRDEAL